MIIQKFKFLAAGLVFLSISCNSDIEPDLGDNGDLSHEAEHYEDDQIKKQSGTDRQDDIQLFARESALYHNMEIRLAEIGEQKARNAEVKKFASRVKSEHQFALKKLRAIANKNSWQWPQELNEDQMQQIEELSKTKTEDFDREFVELMVQSHDEAMNRLEDKMREYDNFDPQKGRVNTIEQTDSTISIEGGSKHAIKQTFEWMQETLPVMREHYKTSKALEESL